MVAVDASMVVAPAGALAGGSLVAAVVDATPVVCSAQAAVAALVAGVVAVVAARRRDHG